MSSSQDTAMTGMTSEQQVGLPTSSRSISNLPQGQYHDPVVDTLTMNMRNTYVSSSSDMVVDSQRLITRPPRPISRCIREPPDLGRPRRRPRPETNINSIRLASVTRSISDRENLIATEIERRWGSGQMARNTPAVSEIRHAILQSITAARACACANETAELAVIESANVLAPRRRRELELSNMSDDQLQVRYNMTRDTLRISWGIEQYGARSNRTTNIAEYRQKLRADRWQRDTFQHTGSDNDSFYPDDTRSHHTPMGMRYTREK